PPTEGGSFVGKPTDSRYPPPSTSSAHLLPSWAAAAASRCRQCLDTGWALPRETATLPSGDLQQPPPAFPPTLPDKHWCPKGRAGSDSASLPGRAETSPLPGRAAALQHRRSG